jgi:hypothetical protein
VINLLRKIIAVISSPVCFDRKSIVPVQNTCFRNVGFLRISLLLSRRFIAVPQPVSPQGTFDLAWYPRFHNQTLPRKRKE